MVSKKLLERYELNSIEGYFYMIIGNYTKGKHRQVLEQIQQLGKGQMAKFSEWLDEQRHLSEEAKYMKSKMIKILCHVD
ncbi:hypothetical protein OAH77_04435 [Flavobacteriaceae bacterium]|nr:hypothetical protein [Flavobacteriaceae bacterium]